MSKDWGETFALIRQDFDVEATEPIVTEAQILDILAEKVSYMLDHQPDLIMSLLYRMDVDEQKIIKVLRHPGDEETHRALARLILERQVQRIRTRKKWKK